MTISSMTGFGRSDGAAEGFAWMWEARSVNGRGHDIRLRLPPGHDAIEQALRDAAAKRISRGNVSATLTLERQNGSSSVRLNEQILADVLQAADRIAAIAGGERPNAAALLAIKGVLEVGDASIESTDARAAREKLLIARGLPALSR